MQLDTSSLSSKNNSYPIQFVLLSLRHPLPIVVAEARGDIKMANSSGGNPPARTTAAPPRDTRALDYQWTNEFIKVFTDIRFRLLAVLPPLVAAAVTLLSTSTFGMAPSALAMLGVGLLGFQATLGLVVYDLRNSQLYDANIHRAMLIERELQIETLIKDGSPDSFGGLHALRAPASGALMRIPISHGSALSLIYGSVLAAWIYPIAKGFFLIVGPWLKQCCVTWPPEFARDLFVVGSGATTTATALILAVVGAWLLSRQLRQLDLPGLAFSEIYRQRNRPLPS
jgi:hypothetical protein